MIDRVAGENDDRPLRRQAALDQRRGDVPARGEQLGIGDLAPAGAAFALGHEDTVRCGVGPVMQAIGDAGRIVAERLLRPEVNRAVCAPLDIDDGIAERNRPQREIARAALRAGRGRLCAHDFGFTLAVLCSRNSRIRRFASLSLCATVAISDSINRPVCGLASAIIGSAWSTAKFVSGALEAILVASSSALARPLPASVTYCAKP